MPVLSPLLASVTDATTRSDTFVEAAGTSALTDGETYLVLVTANAVCDQTGSTTELEAVFGSTRFAHTLYRSAAGGAPGPATSGPIQTALIVTGNGADTVAVNFRRVDGDVTRDHFCIAHIACIPLGSLTLGTHYWVAEAANSQTLTNPSAGAGWVGSGDQVEFAPGATGEFLVIATGESQFTAGHTAADLSRMRCRVTEDPSGTPTAYNLQRNTVGAVAGPHTRVEGGNAWGNYALSQRFVDVLTLTSGTTYRFELEREGVTGTANTGYRRERVYVFDLTAWPEFAYSRDVDGQSSADATFATASAAAPSAALDYVLLGATTYSNNNSWIRCSVTLDPSGTPSQLPTSEGFGTALTDNGNTLTDDYAMIGVQWDAQAVTAAQDYALNCVGTLQVCRWGHEHGDFPGAVDDGVATLMIAWGMETSVSPSSSVSTGGTSTMSASMAGTVSGSVTDGGTSTASFALAGTGAMAATLPGTSTMSAAMAGGQGGTASLSGTSGFSASMAGTGSMSAALSGSATVTIERAPFDTNAVVAFVGNSYTQNYGSMPALLEYYLDQRVPGNTANLDAPPHLATTIANSGTDGYYPGMTLGGMAYYPNIDQSSGGSTDALDAIDSVADDFYDAVVLTSDFRRSEDLVPGEGIDWEVLDGAGGTNPNVYGVVLGVIRAVVAQLSSDGSTATPIVRMTHESFNANNYADLDTVERIVRLQVLAARQLASEGVVATVLPDHYVWGRLLWGAFGSVGSGVTTPVPAFSALTHTASSQPGGLNLAWLSRSQGDTAPFALNGHQNAIGTIVGVWLTGYLLFGIDPRGDTTFSGDPSGMPSPFDSMLNPAGDRIYGGHNTGLGNAPYDTGTNPSGPPDSELDLDWSLTTQGQIQDRIVAAVDDFVAGTTEFDLPAVTAGGTSTFAASMAGSGAMSAALSGAASASVSMAGTGSMSCTTGGTSGMSAAMAGSGALTWTTGGTSSMSTSLAGGTTPAVATGGTSGFSASMAGTGSLSTALAGTSAMVVYTIPLVPITSAVVTTGTSRPYTTSGTTRMLRTTNRGLMGQPWYVNPEDEGSALSERVVYPATEADAEGPADLSSVTDVALEVWDGAAWVEIAGTGSVAAEVEGGETWYRLTWTPDTGALQTLSRGTHPRRWHLTVVGGGDLHVPSSSYDVIVVNALPG